MLKQRGKNILVLVFKRNFTRIGLYNIIIHLFLLLTFKFLVIPFMISFFSTGMDYDFFRSALAESGTESESDSENKLKLDKGKAKATEAQVRQQMGYSSQEVEQSNTSEKNDRVTQEEHDRIFARSLQEQEDREFAVFLQENTGKVRSRSLSSDDYSVYSSEIHSDDSENTIKKKLEVKELERTLKRKNPFNDEVNFENSSDKKIKKF